MLRACFNQRGGGDSNPRLSNKPNNHLAGGPIQPLWHLPNLHLIRFPSWFQTEGEGFEPTVGVNPHLFSRQAP